MNLLNETVKTLHTMLTEREISAVELCEEFLANIKELNPELNAILSVAGESALEAAENAQLCIEKGETTGLTGIPCVVTDNIMTKGLLTTCASKMLADFIPPYDAAVVELLKKDGAVLLGKSNVDEFGFGGTLRSGTAVSSLLAPFSLASDAGGAVRQSAAFHGLTGLRPTYGRVSRYGLAAFASSLDQICPIAKTAEDCAIILNSIAGKDSRDATNFKTASDEDFTAKIGAGVKGLKIAIPKEFFGENICEEKRTAILSAAKELEKQGAELIDTSMSITDYAVAVYYIISSAEASGNLSRYDGVNFGLRGEGNSYSEQIKDSRNRGFGNGVKRRIMFGNFVLSEENYEDYFMKAQALRQKIRAEYEEVFKTADLVLSPTVPDIHPPDSIIPQTSYAYTFTVSPALAGLPSVSTTCGFKMTGLPIGMSLTGKRFAEQTVLQAADCFERIFAEG